jgi:hypothetical protein
MKDPECRLDGAPGWSSASPALFLEGLDNPELSLLRINFPQNADGYLLLEIVSAANKSCQLRNLTDLALCGGNLINGPPKAPYDLTPRFQYPYPQDPHFKTVHFQNPGIQSEELREALNMFFHSHTSRHFS